MLSTAMLVWFLGAAPLAEAPVPEVAWQPWSLSAFALAQREHKLVLLDVGTAWCHWCHVMEQTTYADPRVRGLVARHYVALKADADAEPLLAARYERWGWPATIVLAADGSEIVKRRGYLSPGQLAGLLQAIVDDPSPGPSVVAEPAPSRDASALTEAERAALAHGVDDLYDDAHAGWGTVHKLIDLDTVLDALERPDPRSQKRALDTLEAAGALIDPVWGGVAQYSDKLDWTGPHFEKLAAVQAQALVAYSVAFARHHRAADLERARRVHGYVTAFLRAPDGGFYASQDADLSAEVDGRTYYALDDAARRRRGVPRVDTHAYAEVAGLVAQALCVFSDVSGDAAARSEAEQAVRWAQAKRRLPDGLFAHGDDLGAPPALADSLAVGQAQWALASSTGEAVWLDEAVKTAKAIAQAFGAADGLGYVTAPAPAGAVGALQQPVRRAEENAALARWVHALAAAAEDPALEAMASQAERFAVATARAQPRLVWPSVLRSERAMGQKPVHVVVAGPTGDSATTLLQAARAAPVSERLIERLLPGAPRPARLPTFPQLTHAAAFVCGAGSCSRPLTDPAQVQAAMTSRQ
jgi:hypothetical protein